MIIITGASRGIGKYLFDCFKTLNNEVIGTYNSSSVSQEGMYKLDVANFQSVQSLFSSLTFENVTLINCAGINYNAFAHKSDPEEWKRVIDVNLIGTYNVIRALLPKMREDNFGRIINFSSVVSEKATPGVSAYAASKSALLGLAKSIAVENASKNITINNINMGYSEFGMIQEVPEAYLKEIIKTIPNHKLCDGESIMLTVQLLMQTDYLNGTSINLNGGLI